MTPLTVVLYFLAVARLTHLVVEDSILDRPRVWLDEAPMASGKAIGKGWDLLRAVVSCPWCASVYLAAGTYAAVALGLPNWCLVIPAASYVTGWFEMALGAMGE